MAPKKTSKNSDPDDEPGPSEDELVPKDEKKGEGHIAKSEEEEELIDKKVEEESQDYRRKLVVRPKTISFTPSTLQRRKIEAPKKTWKPLGAGVLLLVIAIVGLITSSNLIMTIENRPLYSPNTGSLKGYILNNDGERLAGARVDIVGKSLTIYSNADGKYEFKSIPKGECILEATFPGYRTVTFPTMILGGTQLQGIGDTNLTLPKVTALGTDFTKVTALLRGQILDNNQNPEAGATVRDEALGKNATSGNDGSFDLGAVPVGKRTVVVRLSGFYDQRVTFYLVSNSTSLTVTLSPGNGTRIQDLTSGTGHIRGQVLDEKGAPVPYALVEANGTALLANATGHFDLSVDAGIVTVTATAVSKTSTYARTYVGTGADGAEVLLALDFDIPATLPGDRDALRADLTTCGAVMIGLSAFMLFTAIRAFQRRGFWLPVGGSLLGAVMMFVTFQYAVFLGLAAFALLIFSKRELE